MKLGKKLIVCVFLCLTLGLISGFSTANEISTWYTSIIKPLWNPPNWLFGPVWTILYILMGMAVALIWHSKHPLKKIAIVLFIVQFVLNLLWSYIFFNQHNILLALFEILFMLLSIILTSVLFGKITKTAFYLMVPYILWVSFASYLNYTIYMLNR